jgi:hypothetical protein
MRLGNHGSRAPALTEQLLTCRSEARSTIVRRAEPFVPATVVGLKKGLARNESEWGDHVDWILGTEAVEADR